MTWADFYLICFAGGFAVSLLSFLAGGWHWHFRLPHFPHASLPAAHLPLGHGPLAGGHRTAHPTGGGKAVGHGQASPISPFNFVTFTAFLAWFGGTGYLLTRYWSLWFAMGLGIALLSGLTGAAMVYLFLSRILISPEENLDPADYEMVGVLGRISAPIRERGTGEIIYSQAGTRRACGARAEDGSTIAKGSEVVVTRFEKGIAYVRLWSELSGEEPGSAGNDQLRS
jgi:membrane protein implicated in regulation of membrane protease activity